MEFTVKHIISLSEETQSFVAALIMALVQNKPAAVQPEAPKTRTKKVEEPKAAEPEIKQPEPVKEETPTPPVVVEEDDLLDSATAEITADALYKLCVPYLQGDNTAPAVKALFAPLREKHGIKKIMDIPDGARTAFHAAIIALPKPII